MTVFHRRFLRLLLMALILLTFLAALPASAADMGLKVEGAILLADVSPGQAFNHRMTVSIGNADSATDITVQIGGFGQSLSGSYEMIETSDDAVFSACDFITVDREYFHLEPGVAEVINATISIPDDIGSGGRYAIINIMTGAVGNEVGMITSVNVPVALTVKDTLLTHQGKITGLTIEAAGEQAFIISTIFQNTGNHHFKIKGEISVSNTQGETLDTLLVPLTAMSLIPDKSLQLQTIYRPTETLADGTYKLMSSVMLEDGTVLDAKEADFEVKGSIVSVSTPTSVTLKTHLPGTSLISPSSASPSVSQTS